MKIRYDLEQSALAAELGLIEETDNINERTTQLRTLWASSLNSLKAEQERELAAMYPLAMSIMPNIFAHF